MVETERQPAFIRAHLEYAEFEMTKVSMSIYEHAGFVTSKSALFWRSRRGRVLKELAFIAAWILIWTSTVLLLGDVAMSWITDQWWRDDLADFLCARSLLILGGGCFVLSLFVRAAARHLSLYVVGAVVTGIGTVGFVAFGSFWSSWM